MTPSKPARHSDEGRPAHPLDARSGDADGRNPGTGLRLDWLTGAEGVASAAARDTDRLAEPERMEPEAEVRGLLRAVELLDLTTLRDDDSPESVAALCVEARAPLGAMEHVRDGDDRSPVRVAAVCVFDRFVRQAHVVLDGTPVLVAAVTGGFPEALRSRDHRLEAVRTTVAAGADEIDAVITLRYALEGDWAALYEEVGDLRAACGPARLKIILRAGEYANLGAVYQAGLVCCMAGADFIKTSTGREAVNATFPIGLAMAAAIRAYGDRGGHTVGLKAAGGIRTADSCLAWLRLVRGALGEQWLAPSRFRIGASSALTSIRRRLAALDGAG